MGSRCARSVRVGMAILSLALAPLLTGVAFAGQELRVGLASRDVTPEGPIWLSGYAARDHASERVAQRLLATAAAFADDAGERFVLVALDNCEVNRAFNEPVLAALKTQLGLSPDQVIIISSHTHSGPCLAQVLPAMFRFQDLENERVEGYSKKLRETLVEVIAAAVADLKPAQFDFGKGWAGFAMNRRVFRNDRVEFGENPEGPVDEEVPVLRVSAPPGEGKDQGPGEIRAIFFGYACHGTTVGGATSPSDFYAVSADYMGHAREDIEAAFPGARALYMTGFGGDANPSPRGSLALARRHGLELAGAVAGVLARPLRPVRGPIRRAFARIDLPLAPAPDRARLDADGASKDPYVTARARAWLAIIEAGKPLPSSVSLPLSVIRFGDDLTLFCMGGEVVVDYSLRLKREFARLNPWTIGYAFEVPCYIPSARILKEGGYEAESSLIYYGIYGPLQGRIEEMIIAKFRELAAAAGAQ